MKIAFYTLGCKVNQNETAALQQMFLDSGHTIVKNNEQADIYIVNSCTVTASGDTKSLQWLRRARRANPMAITVLTGCFPQASPEAAILKEADIVTGTAGRSRLLQNIQLFCKTRLQVVDIQPHTNDEVFEELPLAAHPERTRAFVKIQDGCNRRCAYCIIPAARGSVRSRAIEDIHSELISLAQNGYQEVVFTGINLPSYGQDTGACLADVVELAAEVEGIRRIRLSSLDPDLITKQQVHRFAAQPKLCPSFHLSLQSGCDATLRRMRRPYTTTQYAEAVKTLRANIPGAMFTTDVIVGFPQETEQDFLESLDFVRKIGFLKVHVFPFSSRPGTAAASFDGQLSKREKQRRAALMQAAADEVRAEIINSLHETTQQVLLEKPQPDGRFTGYTEGYIPVVVAAPVSKAGDIVSCALKHWDGERCTAILL